MTSVYRKITHRAILLAPVGRATVAQAQVR